MASWRAAKSSTRSSSSDAIISELNIRGFLSLENFAKQRLTAIHPSSGLFGSSSFRSLGPRRIPELLRRGADPVLMLVDGFDSLVWPGRVFLVPIPILFAASLAAAAIASGLSDLMFHVGRGRDPDGPAWLPL